MGHAHDVIDELRGPTRSLRQAAPQAWEGFAKLHDAAVSDGVLSARIKELMALAHRGCQSVRGASLITPRLQHDRGQLPKKLPRRSRWPC